MLGKGQTKSYPNHKQIQGGGVIPQRKPGFWEQQERRGMGLGKKTTLGHECDRVGKEALRPVPRFLAQMAVDVDTLNKD